MSEQRKLEAQEEMEKYGEAGEFAFQMELLCEKAYNQGLPFFVLFGVLQALMKKTEHAYHQTISQMLLEDRISQAIQTVTGEEPLQ